MAKKTPGFHVRVTPVGDWRRIDGFLKLTAEQARSALDRATRRGARLFHENLQVAYQHGLPGHAPLNPFTIAQKGGNTQPLYDTGAMAQAVELAVAAQGASFEYLIGIPDGELALRARVHETGALLVVTDRMRGYLAAQGLNLNPATQWLNIPARPVFQPVVDETLPLIRTIVEQEVRRELEQAPPAQPGLFARLWAKISR